jgi:hypothetical protein
MFYPVLCFSHSLSLLSPLISIFFSLQVSLFSFCPFLSHFKVTIMLYVLRSLSQFLLRLSLSFSPLFICVFLSHFLLRFSNFLLCVCLIFFCLCVCVSLSFSSMFVCVSLSFSLSFSFVYTIFFSLSPLSSSHFILCVSLSLFFLCLSLFFLFLYLSFLCLYLSGLDNWQLVLLLSESGINQTSTWIDSTVATLKGPAL